MSIVHIKASKKQISKLRNGHKVRIKPAIEGEGINLIISPDRYNQVTKTFDLGKGMEIALTPEEIAVNQEASTQMKGTGIFGKKFDKFLEKKGVKDIAYKLGDTAKPLVKAGILGALGTAATGLAGTELVSSGGLGAGAVPLIYGTAGSLGALANDYLDNPSKYQAQYKEQKSNAGGPINKIAPSTLQGQVAQNEVLNNLNRELGTKYNNLAEASLKNFEAQTAGDIMTDKQIKERKNPYGIYGYGLRKREKSSIGIRGNLVPHSTNLPPALQSQPFSANFQFRHTLPPAYQLK